MTIQQLIASFKCHKDEFQCPEDAYDEGSRDAWELAIEEAEKLEKSMVEFKPVGVKYYSENNKLLKLYAVEVEEKI